jgi:hypothetical protein
MSIKYLLETIVAKILQVILKYHIKLASRKESTTIRFLFKI